MKIGEALALIKAKKGYIASQYELLNEQMHYEVGKKPDFDAHEIIDNIEKTERELRQLKLSVAIANMEKKLDNEMSLAEAIIYIGDLRSKIGQMSKAAKNPHRGRLYYDVDEKRIEYVPQIHPKEIDNRVRELEAEKRKLDAELQKANWKLEV